MSREILGVIVSGIGMIFIAIGLIGMFRFDNFYARALVASKVDTVGYITVLFGVMIRHGFQLFTLKLFLLVIIMMTINPVVTHILIRGAHMSGYRLSKGDGESEENSE